jgi:trehalose transport system substrate-binding protein
MNRQWLRQAKCLSMTFFILLSFFVAPGCQKKEKVLNVSFSLAESEWQVLKTMVFPEFEKKHDVRINPVQIDAADLPKLLKAGKLADRSSLDLFAQDNMQLAILIKEGLVKDLSRNEKIIPKQVYPPMIDAGRFDGKLYFIPFRPNVQIFYYNEVKFNEYGLKPPASWEEWMNVAKTFYAKEGVGRVLIKGFGGAVTTTQMYEYIVSAGGDPFAFNDQGSKKTFGFFQELWKYASPDSKKAKWDTSNDYLAQDSVYIMQNWPFGYKIITKDYGKKGIKVYRGFKGPEREAHVVGGDVFGIPVGAQNEDVALEFIQYLISKPVQTVFVRELNWPSIRSDANAEARDPELFNAVSDALAHGVFRKNVPYWTEYQKLFEEAFFRVVVNSENLSLLDEFNKRMTAIIKSKE